MLKDWDMPRRERFFRPVNQGDACGAQRRDLARGKKDRSPALADLYGRLEVAVKASDPLEDIRNTPAHPRRSLERAGTYHRKALDGLLAEVRAAATRPNHR